MNEKTVKWIRKATAGTTITRSGMKALRRLYCATPRPEKKNFSVPTAVALLQRQELVRRAAVFETVKKIKAVILERKRRRRKQFLMAIPMAIAAALRGGRKK